MDRWDPLSVVLFLMNCQERKWTWLLVEVCIETYNHQGLSSLEQKRTQLWIVIAKLFIVSESGMITPHLIETKGKKEPRFLSGCKDFKIFIDRYIARLYCWTGSKRYSTIRRRVEHHKRGCTHETTSVWLVASSVWDNTMWLSWRGYGRAASHRHTWPTCGTH